VCHLPPVTEPLEVADVGVDHIGFPCRVCGVEIEFLLGDGQVTLVDRDAFGVAHGACLDALPR
jgi:hypothetical protein